MGNMRCQGNAMGCQRAHAIMLSPPHEAPTMQALLRDPRLEEILRRAVAPFIAQEPPHMFDKCTDVTKTVYELSKQLVQDHACKVYIVTGTWDLEMACPEFRDLYSAKYPGGYATYVAHQWLLIAPGDAVDPETNGTFIDPTACQFSTYPWTIQGCFDTSHDQAGKARQKDRVIPAKDVW